MVRDGTILDKSNIDRRKDERVVGRGALLEKQGARYVINNILLTFHSRGSEEFSDDYLFR
jgi:hypothetical protein